MGMMLQGAWHDVPRDTRSTGGEFIRPDSAFRDRVSADGGAGFKAEAERYRLYVATGCPWAHRTLIVRALKGLEDALPVAVADPVLGANGWEFGGRGGIRCLHELYAASRPDYSGRVTVPVLWDTARRTIVNNESSEIIRMLNREFDAFAKRELPDLYPEELRQEIDPINERVYRTVNNGVYRAGFASAQDKYESAVTELFETLDWLEQRLAQRRWLAGERFTEADVRLFATLYRFDSVYHGLFKCNLRRLTDYPNLWRHTRALYALPGVAQTADLAEIKLHYYRSMPEINPARIVPLGPALDFSA